MDFPRIEWTEHRLSVTVTTGYPILNKWLILHYTNFT